VRRWEKEGERGRDKMDFSVGRLGQRAK